MTSSKRAFAIMLLLALPGCGQKAGVANLRNSATGIAAGSTETGTTVDEGLPAAAGAEAQPGVAAAPGAPAPGGAAGTAAKPAAGAAATARPGAAAGPAAVTGPEDRTGITDKEIVIGVHAPITGAAAVSTFEQGVRVYFEYSKNKQLPAVGNRHVRVEYEDDKFDPSSARLACRKLVEEKKAFLLIGGAGADQIDTCANYANGIGVPYLSAGVHEGNLMKLNNYFATSESYLQQSPQLAQLIKNQIPGKTNLGILTTDSELLDETVKSMETAAAANGIKVVYKGKIRKDGSKGDTDAQVSELQKAKADVVYALIPPTVFGFLMASAKQQGYAPPFIGPGLSNGVNLIAKAICQPPFPDVRYFSPMVQMDKIDQHDADYQPAYRELNGASSQPDDIGILLWGISKTVRLMMDAAGPQISRQRFVAAVQSGKTFASNVYSPVTYAPGKRLGANTVTLLVLDCATLQYTTRAAFASSF
jgi:ABC-type branched-subunit amino acid transport system substrate-binding protein